MGINSRGAEGSWQHGSSMLAKSNEAKANHWVLANKKTGKVASSNNWLLALAAQAHNIDETSGIAGLLPQEKAEKLLVSNKISTKVARTANNGRLTDIISNQAVTLLPQLAVLFVEQSPVHKTITRENLCVWITKQLADETSFAYRNALHSGCENLIYNTTGDKPRSARWWLDQIKKMQS